jgi:gliding motility-associated-like protein
MKKAFQILVFVSVSAFSPLFAQYDNTIWFFGTRNAGLRFDLSTSQPQPYTINSPLNGEGSSVAVHPATGQLLFYTDGNNVYNRNHEPMPNGTGLGGCPSSAQAALIVPIPGAPEKYYVFSNTKGSNCATEELRVSIVDMYLEHGLGDIYAGNSGVIVKEFVNEGMVAIPQPGTPNFWLIGNTGNSEGSHYVIHITANGINLASVSNFGYYGNSLCMSYHENTCKITISYPEDAKVLLIDFDASNGILSNPQSIPAIERVYDAELSPDGTKLYYSSWRSVIIEQYDLLTGQKTTLFSAPENINGGGLKKGPDGKIYHILNSGDTFLAVIDRPNMPGAACEYQVDGINLHNFIGGLNLPEMAAVSSSTPNTMISGIINDYTAVESICGNLFEVESSSRFSPGDMVLIIQMQGAVIDTSNAASFGDILEIGSAGNYEINVVRSVEGNVIRLKNKILKEYIVGGQVQLIRVPNLGDAAVGNLTALPWNGKTGGVLAFVGGNIVLHGNIDVSGRGFRGGQLMNLEGTTCPNSFGYFYDITKIDSSGLKGEGIAVLPDTHSRGRGKAANGGGGGNNHNAGGGGGANFGQGGAGGHFTCVDDPVSTRGIGGGALVFLGSESQKIFMGGGGGAGHSNNHYGFSGGDGGGIVLAWVNTIQAHPYLIKANGESVGNGSTFNDGGGGGGAGGAIHIHFGGENPFPIEVQVNGGHGGSIMSNHGHGGGGGAGALMVNTLPFGTINLAAFGGRNGKGDNGAINGATEGANGNIMTGFHFPQAFEERFPLGVDSILLHSECDGTGSIHVYAVGVESIQFSLNSQDWTPSPTFTNLSGSDFGIFLTDGCETLDTSVTLQTHPILGVDLIYQQEVLCDSLGKVEFFPVGGKPPVKYKLNLNATFQEDGLFEQLTLGDYRLTAVDDRGCIFLYDFVVNDGSYEILIDIPADTLITKGDEVELPITISPFNPPHKYEWLPQKDVNCVDCPSPIFSPLLSREYYLQVKDHFGCTGYGISRINVKNYSAYLPDAISINEDGVNDYFYVMGAADKIVRVISLKVFDRWGGLVFSAADTPANVKESGWNGNIKGRKAPAGVYTYWAEIEFFDEGIITKRGALHVFR